MVVNAVATVDADHPEADADDGGDDGQAGRDQRAEGDDQHEQGDAYAEQLALAAGLGHGLHPGAVDLGRQPVVTRCVQRVQHLGLCARSSTSATDFTSKVHVMVPTRPSWLSGSASWRSPAAVALGRPRLLGARHGPLVLPCRTACTGLASPSPFGICGTDWRSAIRSSTLSA